MALKSLVILFAVAVFGVCSSIRFGTGIRDQFTLHDYLRWRAHITTTTEKQVKESRQYNQGVHKNYFVSDEALNWYDARDECYIRRMVLASTNTIEEKNHLENYLLEHSLGPKDAYSGYWIGSHRASTNEPWIWEPNDQQLSSDFGWCPGEPSAFLGENCMELKQDYSMLGWNNFYCENPRRFICENLPMNDESDKNTVTDKKYVVHEELTKNIGNKEAEIEDVSTTEDDSSISDDVAVDIQPEPSASSFYYRFYLPEESEPVQQRQIISKYLDESEVDPIINQDDTIYYPHDDDIEYAYIQPTPVQSEPNDDDYYTSIEE